MRYKFLVLLFFELFFETAFAQLSINEIMQSNIDCIMDDRNEFPDSWVELFNIGASPENLKNYSIGLTDNAQEAWQLRDSIIGVGGAVLIYCDNSKDEKPSLHANFRLESGKGGDLFLFRNGVILDKIIKIKKQPAPNISYGRLEEKSEEWGYQCVPSPNAPNCGILCNDILGDPIFSIHGRIFDQEQPRNLELSIPDNSPEGTVIRYTLDGSEPTNLSDLYTSPLSIKGNTIVRAKLFCDGYLSPRSVSHSYLFHGRDVTLPVISIVSDKDFFYNDKVGILVDGNYNPSKANYTYNWRRPINFEYFEDKEKESELNQLCEARVAGNSTRIFPLKSLCIYANKRFGQKRLKYVFFSDQRPLVNDFKSIVLRNSGDDFYSLYMRDAIIQRSMSPYIEIDWQAWSPAILYINGDYKGILNIRERSNEDNIYTHYNGLEKIDMIENWWDLKVGDMDHFNKFMSFIEEESHTIDEFNKWVDVSEFLNLMIVNLFYCNLDFPGSNIMLWRPKSENGRWRVIAKDTDHSLGINDVPPDYNVLEWLYNPDFDPNHNWGANRSEGTLLFRRLMEDPSLRDAFIERSAIYMGDFLKEKLVRELWDSMYDRVKSELPYHRSLFKYDSEYDEELRKAHDWLSQRYYYHYNNIASFYHVGSPCKLTINQADIADKIETSINGIKLATGCFDGYYYANRNLSIIANNKDEDKKITGWTIKIINNNCVNDSIIYGKTFFLNMPLCEHAIIHPIINGSNGIKDKNVMQQWKGKTEYRNSSLIVRGITKGIKVSLYGMNGMLLYQKVSLKDVLNIPIDKKGPYILQVGNTNKKIVI